MKSRWSHLKEDAIVMRKSGMSMTTIEKKLGIARSTLSSWFKHIHLSEDQKNQLIKNKADGWAKARIKAVESHKAQKALRLLDAKKSAKITLDQIELTNPILDLAFAMLYLGEGAKNGTTSIASSDPKILNLVLTVLEINYKKSRKSISCELHLRADQNPIIIKNYWSKILNIPISNFKYVAFDKRTIGKPTYDTYKGVCVLQCGSIAIQRKLINLYNLFCDKVVQLDKGD